MVFSSILFLCFFLPITLWVYYLLPGKCRNLVLFLASLFFYAWGEPKYLWIMLFSTVFDYTNGRLLEYFDKKESVRKLILVSSLVGNLGLLCFFKYTDFFLINMNQITGTNFSLLGLALPIGISFYTFQTLSYTIDVYLRRINVQKNILDFGMYICLFPQLIAGPIVRYSDVEKEIRGRQESISLIWNGLIRFSIGLAKKVLFANQIGVLWDEISSYGTMPAATAWIGALAYTFQIYFDFSGYSDMAIGLGQMFGFHFPENFLHPYESKSITEFWRRWHITLGTWFREYLYIPLGGNRCGKKRQVLNLFLVWILTGFWHGAGWNFLLWGLFYFVLLVFEKMFWLKRLEKLPTWISHAYTMLFVVIGWAIFANDQFSAMLSYLKSMFGAYGMADGMSLYYLSTYGVLFLILILGCTSIPKQWMEQMKGKLLQKTWLPVVQFALILSLIGVGMVFMVGDSYNPFLYFRF